MIRERLVGTFSAGRDGPTVIALGQVHGDEPAGTAAASRVLEALQEQQVPIRGAFAVVLGNRQAAARDAPWVETDLSQRWTVPEIDALMVQDPTADAAEQREQRELLALFEQLHGDAAGPVACLDLHSTPVRGVPFIVTADTAESHELARKMPLPVIERLDRLVPGTVLDYWRRLRAAALRIEGGQHRSMATVAFLEGATWLALVATGALDAAHVPHFDSHQTLLRSAAAKLPGRFEVFHRHALLPGDGFELAAGYANFQVVEQGERLATDRRGAICAIADGHLLLPLGEAEGEHGFFLGHAVQT